MNATLLLLATAVNDLRWANMPANWVLVMIIIPVTLMLGWWAYSREGELSKPRRLVLGTLRTLSILVVLVLVFGPFAEVSKTQVVRAHLLVLVDDSDSMSTVDGYEPEDAAALAAATGLTPVEVTQRTRLDLVKRVMVDKDRALLKRLLGDFRVHFFSFSSRLSPVVSAGDTSGEPDPNAPPDDEKVAMRLNAVTATGPSTRMGQAVATVLDMFHYRDEPVAAVVVLTDGQQNGGSMSPPQAGRKAAGQHVPIYSIGVGDPRSPKNIHVSNLRAMEVVLARDTAVFEFTVRANGFAGRPVPLEIQELGTEGEPIGRPLLISPGEVVLEGGEEEQKIKVAHRFMRAGTFALRIGVPVQDEEKIKSDNFVLHTIRVIDRKIKVLYVEGRARWEYVYLSNALCRDTETLLAHALLLDADPDTPQRASEVPDWKALTRNDGVPDREALFEYDVIILGDVDPRHLGATTKASDEALANLREFVEKGGGLVMIAGSRHNPTKYLGTPLEDVLPVVIDRGAERTDPRFDPSHRFPFVMTPEGERSPLLDIAHDPARSKETWERGEDAQDWQQYWIYPAHRAKTGARVLLVSGEERHRNRFGPRPIVATLLFGRGRVLYVGADDMWRVRKYVGDQFFYSFYGEGVRFLAKYKLLGGNRRFKILTDRDKYTLDDTVRITLDVLDRDYQPAREPTQKVLLEMPGPEPGTRETVELEASQTDDRGVGTYTKRIVPTRPGDYRLSAEPDDPEEEAPNKLFHVVRSSLEGRDLLLDEAALRNMATASAGGRYLHLKDIAKELTPAPSTKRIPSESHTTELWDNGWSLLLALGLLGAEWMLRKRWHLV